MKLSEQEKLQLVYKTIEKLKIAGRSENTINNYRCALIRFLSKYDDSKKLEDYTEEDVIEYMKKEYVSKNVTADTYNLNLSAIKKMFLVCYKKTFLNDLLPSVKQHRHLPAFLEKDKFLYIFNNECSINHKCWLLLAFCCGLRADEIATVRIENINSKEHSLRVIGKGNKERITILPDIVIKYLRMYYVNKKITKKHGYLFNGKANKEHPSSRSIVNYFLDLRKIYNLSNKYSIHSLRHSFATYFLMNGGNLFDLQHMMGHSSIATTSIYLHVCQNFNNLKGINYHV